MSKEILSPGKKIKKIRKEFKIKQHEITGGEITRELISIIENDKSTLTPTVAEIIVQNINSLCLKRNIEFHLTTTYLLESVTSQVNKIANEYIETLTNTPYISLDNFMEIVKEIDMFLLKYQAEEMKMSLYEKIGDIFRSQNEYNRSYTYYIKAFESHSKLFNDISLFTLLQKIGNICIMLCRYKESLDFNNLALFYTSNIPEELKYKVLFNTALAYINLKEYDHCLKEIQQIETTFKNLSEQDLFDLTVLKSNCFRAKNFYTNALRLHENLLSSLDHTAYENILLVASNILDIYTILKDTKNIKKYIDILIYSLNNYEDILQSVYVCGIYNQLGDSCNAIGNMDLAVEYYKQSIKACKYHKDKEIIEKSLDAFLTILIERNDVNEINNFKNELLEIISLELIPATNTVIFKYINYYNEIGDRDSIKDLLTFILEK